MDGNVGLSLGPLLCRLKNLHNCQTDRIKFSADIHGSQNMPPLLMISSPEPPWGWHIRVLVSYLDSYWLGCHEFFNISLPSGWDVADLTPHLTPLSGQHVKLSKNVVKETYYAHFQVHNFIFGLVQEYVYMLLSSAAALYSPSVSAPVSSRSRLIGQLAHAWCSTHYNNRAAVLSIFECQISCQA